MENKKTLIVGATSNPTRFAYFAASRFADRKMEFIPIGIKTGEVFGEKILDLRTKPPIENIHTITLYIGPAHQVEWMDYLIGLNPKRIIFNPGTENPAFFKAAEKAGIEVEVACTLVMLSSNQF